jgi:hypothetical protein
MKSYWSGMDLQSNITGVLRRKKERDTVRENVG